MVLLGRSNMSVLDCGPTQIRNLERSSKAKVDQEPLMMELRFREIGGYNLRTPFLLGADRTPIS